MSPENNIAPIFDNAASEDDTPAIRPAVFDDYIDYVIETIGKGGRFKIYESTYRSHSDNASWPFLYADSSQEFDVEGAVAFDALGLNLLAPSEIEETKKDIMGKILQKDPYHRFGGGVLDKIQFDDLKAEYKKRYTKSWMFVVTKNCSVSGVRIGYAHQEPAGLIVKSGIKVNTRLVGYMGDPPIYNQTPFLFESGRMPFKKPEIWLFGRRILQNYETLSPAAVARLIQRGHPFKKENWYSDGMGIEDHVKKPGSDFYSDLAKKARADADQETWDRFHAKVQEILNPPEKPEPKAEKPEKGFFSRLFG